MEFIFSFPKTYQYIELDNPNTHEKLRVSESKKRQARIFISSRLIFLTHNAVWTHRSPSRLSVHLHNMILEGMEKYTPV